MNLLEVSVSNDHDGGPSCWFSSVFLLLTMSPITLSQTMALAYTYKRLLKLVIGSLQLVGGVWLLVSLAWEPQYFAEIGSWVSLLLLLEASVIFRYVGPFSISECGSIGTNRSWHPLT